MCFAFRNHRQTAQGYGGNENVCLLWLVVLPLEPLSRISLSLTLAKYFEHTLGSCRCAGKMGWRLYHRFLGHLPLQHMLSLLYGHYPGTIPRCFKESVLSTSKYFPCSFCSHSSRVTPPSSDSERNPGGLDGINTTTAGSVIDLYIPFSSGVDEVD